jgi:hypothetical protein
MNRRAAIGAALGGATALAVVVALSIAANKTAPPPALREAAPKAFSMEQFRRDSQNQSYSTWVERQAKAHKDCPQCPNLPLPPIPKSEPFEDVAPPRQLLPSQRRPMPEVRPMPDWALPKPKPAKAKGWDI